MSKTTVCVLASSPENVLFVLGIGWNGVSNPLLCHGIHTAARLLYLLLKAFLVLVLTSVPVSNLPGQEGGVFAQHNPLGALRQFSRGLSLTLDAVVGFEPRPQGMNLKCYLCTTTAIYQSTSFFIY